MQEINLLQNKLKDSTHKWESNHRVIVILLSLVLIAILVATGIFYLLSKSAQDGKAALDKENANIQTALDKMEGQLSLAKGFQAQTKNITTLLNTHVVWNEIMDDLADKTFKTSRYLNVSSRTDGVMHIEGMTPSYTELGKLMLALETSDKITEVKLNSTEQSTDQIAGIVFSLDLKIKSGELTGGKE